MSTENEGNEVPPAPSAPPASAEGSERRAETGPSDRTAPGEPSGSAAPAAPAEPSPSTLAFEKPAARPEPQPATGAAPAAPDAPPAAPAAPDAPPAAPGSAPQPPAMPGQPPQAPSAAWPPPPPPVPAYQSGGPQQVYPGAPAEGQPTAQHGQGGYAAYGPGDGQGYGGHGGYGGDQGGNGGWGGGAFQQPQSQPPRRKRGRGVFLAAVIVAALVAGGVGGGIGYWAADRDDSGTGSTTIAAADSPASTKRAAGSVAGIAQAALPSVVTIEAQGGDGEGSTGTGFVYDKQGHILTNNHVVASAASGGKLTATFSNGKKYAAEVIGHAQGYDVAVIKLKNASGLKPLVLGDSDRTAVGDSTIAIGAPFGLSNTVTTGIVSAKDRPVASSDGESAKSSYMSALQTDASINPGNSGGPLLNERGQVIGINSAIQPGNSGGGLGGGSSQGGSIGLGFAIPINQAKRVAEQLIKTGTPVYPVIGATVSLEEGMDGATVSDQGAGSDPAVTPGGPAAKAGLKSGDTITKFDDTIIDSGPTLIGEIWTHQPGDKVKITYKRDGSEHTTEVTLGQRKGDD
ncbi:trypsin-like peptidase domain-containing protein [Streptomyces sp. DSM 41979]|uniref:Trypsin-like peptidase domain-containing protein n=3 Tax=Streptomyces TaxID=1883 RepID=A0ABU2R9J8_9ACTN|nr:trypsin-like peptidase domain-containing protein [Streptomyces sp. DSM 41979]MDT0413361.1 trypsin-like peptidase domain-containing protein [Streptomyces sp. DSM 41979]